MKCFFEEDARSPIDHPNVVRVLNFFRANETVYMVMRYKRGVRCSSRLQDEAGPDVERVRAPRVHASVERPAKSTRTSPAPRHQAGERLPAYRRLVRSSSYFSARAATLTSNRPKLAPMYAPGFATPERHRRRTTWGPGPTSTAPARQCPRASRRSRRRPRRAAAGGHLVAAKKIWAGQYDNLLEVIDWCLRLDPLERPRSVRPAEGDPQHPPRTTAPIGNLEAPLLIGA